MKPFSSVHTWIAANSPGCMHVDNTWQLTGILFKSAWATSILTSSFPVQTCWFWWVATQEEAYAYHCFRSLCNRRWRNTLERAIIHQCCLHILILDAPCHLCCVALLRHPILQHSSNSLHPFSLWQWQHYLTGENVHVHSRHMPR